MSLERGQVHEHFLSILAALRTYGRLRLDQLLSANLLVDGKQLVSWDLGLGCSGTADWRFELQIAVLRQVDRETDFVLSASAGGLALSTFLAEVRACLRFSLLLL